jgi:hypothetical protein
MRLFQGKLLPWMMGQSVDFALLDKEKKSSTIYELKMKTNI